MADEITTPGAGAITYTGAASTLNLAINLGIGGSYYTSGNDFTIVAGYTSGNDFVFNDETMRYAGQASTVSATTGTNTQPGNGAILYTGQQSTVVVPGDATQPGAGAITYTGQGGALDTALGLSGGSLLYTGNAPTAMQTLSTLPGNGGQDYSGQVSVIDYAIAFGNGSLLYTGQAPTEMQTLSTLPGNGGEVYTGQASTLSSSDNPTAAPGNSQLSYAGNSNVLNLALGTGSASEGYTGQQNTEAQTWSASPGIGQEIYTGNGSVLDTALALDAGQEIYAGQQSTEAQTWSAAPGNGEEAYAGQASLLNHTLTTGTAAEAYNGQAPSMDVALLIAAGAIQYNGNGSALNTAIATSSGNALYAGQAPSLDGSDHRFAAPGNGSFEYTGQSSTLAQTENQWTLPGTGNLAYAGTASSFSWAIEGSAGNVRYLGNPPVADTGNNHTVQTNEATLLYSGQTSSPSFTEHHFRLLGDGQLVYTGQAPFEYNEYRINPGYASLIYTGQGNYVRIEGVYPSSVEWIIVEQASNNILASSLPKSLIVEQLSGKIIVPHQPSTLIN